MLAAFGTAYIRSFSRNFCFPFAQKKWVRCFYKKDALPGCKGNYQFGAGAVI